MNEEQVAKDFLRAMIKSYVTAAKVRQYLSRHYPAALAADPRLPEKVQSRVRSIRIL